METKTMLSFLHPYKSATKRTCIQLVITRQHFRIIKNVKNPEQKCNTPTTPGYPKLFVCLSTWDFGINSCLALEYQTATYKGLYIPRVGHLYCSEA